MHGLTARVPRPPERDDDPRGPLWRGAQYFRALSVLYAVGRQIDEAGRYERIGWSWALVGALVVVSVVAGIGYGRGFGRTVWFVGAEFVAVAGLALSTWAVASPEFIEHNQSIATTLWLTNPVVSSAILGGPLGGVIGGVLIAGLNAVYRGTFPATTLRDAMYPVMMSVGLGVGMAARVATRSRAELLQAERVAADARARERLARDVHDGTLQALALLARRCGALGAAGSELAELGALAARQEQALRRMIAEQPDSSVRVDGAHPPQRIDLRELLRPLASATVTLAEPGRAVELPTETATELVAAVRNALENTDRHAGTGARSFLLIEDLDDAVAVTVRDDGAGIEPGRLDAARAEGRLGVTESIVGRIQALGGRAELTTEPGEGVEWELWIPRT